MTREEALTEVINLAEHSRKINDEQGVEFFDILADALRSKIADEQIQFTRCETYNNCTVQVLSNDDTGVCSIGWWQNGKPPRTIDK